MKLLLYVSEEIKRDHFFKKTETFTTRRWVFVRFLSGCNCKIWVISCKSSLCWGSIKLREAGCVSVYEPRVQFQGFLLWYFIDVSVSCTSAIEQNIVSPGVCLTFGSMRSPFILTHSRTACGHCAAVTDTHTHKHGAAAVLACTRLNTAARNLKYSFNLWVFFALFRLLSWASLFTQTKQISATLITVPLARSALISPAWARPLEFGRI